MTYKDQIEHLLRESVQKSQAYIATINRKQKNPRPAELAVREKSYKEWEAAESAYTSFMISMKMQKINTGDAMNG